MPTTLKIAIGVGCGILLAGAVLVAGCVGLIGIGMTKAELDRSSARSSGPASASPSPQLKVDVIRFDATGDYFHVRGLVTNTSGEPVRFVKVEALYLDSGGKTLDTDWTYAVDSHPLAPGADRTFEVQTEAVPGVTSVQVRVQR